MEEEMWKDLYTATSRMSPVEDDETVSAAGFHAAAATIEVGDTMTSTHRLRAEGPGAPASDFHTLTSAAELSFSQELQISLSSISEQPAAPAPGILWAPDVLEGFSSLADFSFSEAAALRPLLQSPPDERLLQVKEFLVVFQSQQGALLQLRELAKKLKDMNRKDVTTRMRHQRRLLRWIGPASPEELPIKDMKVSQRFNFTTALSITDPTGNDWRCLADTLSIPRHHTDLWHDRHGDPAEMVLKSWEVKVTEATVGRLFDLMMDMDRGDLAFLL